MRGGSDQLLELTDRRRHDDQRQPDDTRAAASVVRAMARPRPNPRISMCRTTWSSATGRHHRRHGQGEGHPGLEDEQHRRRGGHHREAGGERGPECQLRAHGVNGQLEAGVPAELKTLFAG